jgi:hypothetical protein
MKPKKTKWIGHVARIWKNEYKALVGMARIGTVRET